MAISWPEGISGMDNELTKGMREVEIFSRFVSSAELPIDLDTIEKCNPPEPDILCAHRDDGPVAFELVEICDPNLAEFFSTVDEGGAFYMRTGDPTPWIIRKKLRRTYQTEYPMELLCYTDGRVVTPAEVILPNLRLFLAPYRGPFRRAWLLSRGDVYHVWPRKEDNR
jgi:hypothetical protein